MAPGPIATQRVDGMWHDLFNLFREDERELYHPAEAGGLRAGKRRSWRNAA